MHSDFFLSPSLSVNLGRIKAIRASKRKQIPTVLSEIGVGRVAYRVVPGDPEGPLITGALCG